MDTRQRLVSSLLIFLPTKSVYEPNASRFTGEKLWFKSTASGARRRLLPQYLKTQFANKQIVCVEYTELDGDQEREIFQASKQVYILVDFLL